MFQNVDSFLNSVMSFITANQITLHYVSDGAQTGTPLVFINSLGTNLHLWDALVPSLPAQYRFLRYDKRGHGLSDTPPFSMNVNLFCWRFLSADGTTLPSRNVHIISEME